MTDRPVPSPPSPVPGSAAALWHKTLEGLRAAGQVRTAALWAATTPLARGPETLTISAPTPFACAQLTERARLHQIQEALAGATGQRLRLVCALDSAPDDLDDPLIAAVLARINALNTPPDAQALDISSQER